MASSFTRFLDHTQWRSTVGRTLLDEWSARRTQHSRQTDIHASGGNRTHNLSRLAAADLRLRPRGNSSWPMRSFPWFISVSPDKCWDVGVHSSASSDRAGLVFGAGVPCYLMVTLHPFLADFLHWRTRRTHRSTTLWRACGHTAHAPRPSSRQFLMGLNVECIKMEEQLIVRKPFVENIIIRGREKRLGEPNFWRKRKVWRVSDFVPNAAGASTKFFFSVFLEWGQTHSGTSYIILSFLECLRINHFLLI